MEIILEIIFEIIINVFGELLFEALGSRFSKKKTESHAPASEFNFTRPSRFVIAILYLIAGAVMGGISLMVFSEPFLNNDMLRIGNLIISPLVAGIIMQQIGKQKLRFGKQPAVLDNFYYGFTFAFGLSLVRFLANI